MLAMENTSRYSREAQPHSSFRRRRSGYEPSDTETEWHESPWHDVPKASVRPKTPTQTGRSISPLDYIMNPTSMDNKSSNRSSSAPRRHSKSPYKSFRDGDDHRLSPRARSDLRRNASPFGAQREHIHASPYKAKGEDQLNCDEIAERNGSFRRQNTRTPPRAYNSAQKQSHSYFPEFSRVSNRSNNSHRSSSAPKPRAREKEHSSLLPNAVLHNAKDGHGLKDHASIEINEVIANMKLSKSPSSNNLLLQSTDSISRGDIFFSRDIAAPKQEFGTKKNSAPQLKVVPERNTTGSFSQNTHNVSSSSVISQTNVSSVSTGSSRVRNDSGKLSDVSGKSGGSLRKFTANMQKIQSDTTWFSCVRTPSCGRSRSPDSKGINEASLIEKAFVVEELRLFWADKYRPCSLDGFIIHKQLAQHLKQLISHSDCPHIIFKGPSGSGKKSLCMALLQEIFGDSALSVSHDLKHYQIEESGPMQIVVPLISSPHHVELNLKSERKNARYVLMALVKEIAAKQALAVEVSEISLKADYRVMLLHDVDKAAENVQFLIKWIIDCYSDVCKIIFCCEDDGGIIDSIKNRCKLVRVDAPVTNEIMEVLIQIANKEKFELSMKFAARIATKSKQNLRKAIMALEACKAHKYPFNDEQPIPQGWEEVLVELAAEILADPSHKRLFLVRGKLQKLLAEFVHPKLILQKLVEQFLKGIEASLKRELYYWHAYYEKRLPTGTSALLKLEEFVAKFMSIQRKSFSST